MVRIVRGEDIRRHGSGNIGATNVWRLYGRGLGLLVALLDVAKGFVPVLVATLTHGHLAGALTGGAAILGHWRPLFLGFQRGGKVVATCGGAFLGLAPFVGLVVCLIWIAIFLITRYASVSSMLAAVSLPAVSLVLGEPWPVVAFSAGAALAILLLHRPNLARLRAGTEKRVQLRRRSDAAPRTS
ncbi:MAG: glycerol-3-phosphate 1-O-acyltransferase PlsY [Actinobacteria bacterium]|nr:glycerol-3-phosphate 1-O-acyltransferase PlsY [Actinomycetota bacterium]